MTTKDKVEIGKIYESLDFKSSYDKNYDPNLKRLEVEFNNNCHTMEKWIQGLINYYLTQKIKQSKDPNNMEPYETMEKLTKSLADKLAQFSTWPHPDDQF